MSEEIKELLFLLHNDRLTEAGKRKLEQEIERLKERLSFYESDNDTVLMSKEKWEEIKQELQIEKATNKELLSTGADLENKLYEEQDKNKRLNNIIKEVRELVENGTDFKCITFRKVDEDTWKLILASHIKENFLEILDKENK